jgi:hypothetical protein
MATLKTESRKFIEQVSKDSDIKASLLRAYEAGSKITLEKIIEIGASAGYQFTSDEFRATMRGLVRERYEAGETELADLVSHQGAPESACSSGCLSYTKNWHADVIVM